jgi:hypothetical protein
MTCSLQGLSPCGRREDGQCGRTVEAIEQPIAASACSPFGVLERVQFSSDVHPLCANSRVRSCSPPITARHGHRWRLQPRWCEDIWLVHATVAA